MICKTRYSKIVEKKMYIFYGEFESVQKKDKKNVDLPERGFKPQIFSKFPTWKVRVTRSNLGKVVKISRLSFELRIGNWEHIFLTGFMNVLKSLHRWHNIGRIVLSSEL